MHLIFVIYAPGPVLSYIHTYLVAQMVKSVGHPGSIPGSGGSPGEVNGNPLQYSCLGNPMDRVALKATVHGVTKSWTQLSDFTFTFSHTYVSIYVLLCLASYL